MDEKWLYVQVGWQQFKSAKKITEKLEQAGLYAASSVGGGKKPAENTGYEIKHTHRGKKSKENAWKGKRK